MISADSCSQVVAGNYDVLVNEPSFRLVLTDFLDRFEQHELELSQQPESGYASEFKLLKEFSKSLKEDKANLQEGELEVNLRKNRYKDILPFSHTRVVLSGDLQVPGSGYINANYIRGPSGSPKAYIACQGPLACTLVDFWRMIWECNVSVIVMACNENESGKPKCELYWPEQVESSQCYGNIQVTLVKVRQFCADFIIRKFSVKLLLPPETTAPADGNGTNIINPDSVNNNNYNHNSTYKNSPGSNIINNNNNNNDNNINNNSTSDDNPKAAILKGNHHGYAESIRRGVVMERTICQFHYTTWPDHGAPDSVQPILELVRLVRDVQPTEDKPILVHCSAGCGRTGTICCIDFVWGLLRRGKLDLSFDLCSIISDMRQQRMAMVQTLEQYILCHRAVAALFIKQLKLLDKHVYENLDSADNQESAQRMIFDEQDRESVFI